MRGGRRGSGKRITQRTQRTARAKEGKREAIHRLRRFSQMTHHWPPYAIVDEREWRG
jgi:hypothetical protein